MTQYLWIGCLESDEEFKVKAKKGYDLASAQVSQKNILTGLEQVANVTFDSINGSVLPPYPVYADEHIAEVQWSHKSGSLDVSVGYRNNKYENRLNCKKAMKTAAEKWLQERYMGGEVVIITYSMRSAPMSVACYLKKHIKNSRIYLIVTDLPQFMDLGQSKIKSALKRVDWQGIKSMQKDFDGFILYAPKMADFLHIPDSKWLQMEGSYDGVMPESSSTEKKKAIMYSGKLDVQYGIPMLLDAFMDIQNDELELWLTGGGNAKDYVLECAKKDQRIKFFGFLPSRTDVLELQQKAMLLVNMRLPSEPASDYCFPSKLFEYMATGVPVLSFKLGGIPDEYDRYLLYIETESKDAIRDAIENYFDNEYSYKEVGVDARRFIEQNKNLIKQSQRIMSFINS